MQDVIDFFNDHADRWDTYQKPEDPAIIRKIVALADFSRNDSVLDVGCGTGVMVPFYRSVPIADARITAIDAAHRMIAQCRRKFPGITAICTTLADFRSAHPFSKVVIFNAFPHFPDPEGAIHKAASLLTEDGALVIAHTMSREALNAHHRQVAGAVESHTLIPNQDFEAHFRACGLHTAVIQDTPFFFAKANRS